MQPRRLKYFRCALHAAVLACLAFLVLGTVNAGPATGAGSGLTVHEWGTFTVVVGPDGVPARWRPLRSDSDLPEFVKTRDRNGKTEVMGTVRMETPVLYFYSKSEARISVTVDFPDGRITEWYPAALVPANAETIAWNDVLVRPGSDETYPTSTVSSHYYSARETDAAPLVVTTDDGSTQREKMLFYRGVGTFDLPLAVSFQEGNLSLEPRAIGPSHGPTHAIIVDCKDGRVGFVAVELATGADLATWPIKSEGGSAALRSLLAARLEAAGLFPREAAAMIATWGDTWTEEGLRVFFVVPRPVTDRILPLRVTPTPDAVERVLLGRIEIVTPDIEAAVSAMALQFASSVDKRPDALRKLNGLGHFLEPIVKIVAARNGDGPVARALRDALPEVFREY